MCSGTCTQGVSSHAKTRKTGNDTLGGELQNAVLPSFFAPPNKTRYLPGKKSGPTRKQKLDSTPIDVRVRRHRQRLGSNAPIESAPESLLNPTLAVTAGALPIEIIAFLGTNSRIHLKWNSGFDPSFGVLRRSDLRLAIIRTLSDGRDVTQLGPEVFSGTSISQGAQYLGMDTVNSPSQVGHELMC